MKNRKLKKFTKNICIYMSFPHLWIAIIITILLFVSLGISLYLREYSEYYSSIFANIFAGLLTGLIICLISGVKQYSVSKLKCKKKFLEEVNENVIEYRKLYSELLHKKFEQYDNTEELFDFIYDLASHANYINDHIRQSSFDKMISFEPRVYCKKKLSYDAEKLVEEYDRLHQNVYYMDINHSSKKEVLEYFRVVDKEINKLNTKVNNTIYELDLKIEMLSRVLL